MEDHEIEAIMRQLKKRGFITDGVRERCEACEQNGVWIYRLVNAKMGGRDVRWCLACGVTRSFRRNTDDELVEDKNFDLVKFLA